MSVVKDRLIPIRIANKCAYIWDVDDIAILRAKHRLCGILAGTLPHLSQQNVFLGVPLLLMPEEVVLLVENSCVSYNLPYDVLTHGRLAEAAVLIDDPTAHKQPSTSQLNRWDDERRQLATKHINVKDAQIAEKNTSRSMSEDAIRKRKEREARKAAKVAASQSAPLDMLSEDSTPSVSVSETPTANPSDIGVVAPQNPITGNSVYPVVIPAESSALDWYSTDDATYTTIEDAKAAGIWDYPSNLSERARCGVFRGLWEQGHFLGGGIKFGGEYLVYPGDPLRYHSHFVASVIESPLATLRPMEIVAHGRLGTATKKSHLLCGWDDDAKTVSYLSIEWAGFG